MRRLYLFLFVLTLLLPGPLLARTNPTDWYVKDFKTDLVLQTDESLLVTENITADAGNLSDKHGIFRVLPQKFKTDNQTQALPTEIISVTNEQGSAHPYTLNTSQGTLVLKIGDPKNEVKGVNYYNLKYRVANTVQNYPDRDEFFWNILGPDWKLEIDSFQATLKFPEQISAANAHLEIYAGARNAKTNELVDYRWLEDNRVELTARRPLKAGEAVTLVVSFPKNIITPVTLAAEEPVFPWLPILGSVLMVLASLGVGNWLWRTYGRNPGAKKTVVAEYDIPGNLSPIELNALDKRHSVSNHGVAASFINLGVKGYLTFSKEDRWLGPRFTLQRTDKEEAGDLYFAEQKILNTIFKKGNKVNLNKITGLDSLMVTLNKEVPADLTTRQLLGKPSKEYTQKLQLAALVFLGLGAVSALWHIIPLIVGVVIALILFIVSLATVVRTDAGTSLYQHLQGFKLYMKTAEEHRSQFQERAGDLTKLLPYAILFGLTKEWLKALKSVYGDEELGHIMPAFIGSGWNLNDFDAVSDAINQVVSSVDSNVASYSSGGGAGGGGGGGW